VTLNGATVIPPIACRAYWTNLARTWRKCGKQTMIDSPNVKFSKRWLVIVFTMKLPEKH